MADGFIIKIDPVRYNISWPIRLEKNQTESEKSTS